VSSASSSCCGSKTRSASVEEVARHERAGIWLGEDTARVTPHLQSKTCSSSLDSAGGCQTGQAFGPRAASTTSSDGPPVRWLGQFTVSEHRLLGIFSSAAPPSVSLRPRAAPRSRTGSSGTWWSGASRPRAARGADPARRGRAHGSGDRRTGAGRGRESSARRRSLGSVGSPECGRTTARREHGPAPCERAPDSSRARPGEPSHARAPSRDRPRSDQPTAGASTMMKLPSCCWIGLI
jgi:hypothetical protein